MFTCSETVLSSSLGGSRELNCFYVCEASPLLSRDIETEEKLAD